MWQRILTPTAIECAGACLCYGLARCGRTWSVLLAWVLGVFGFLLSLGSPVALLQFAALFAVGMFCLRFRRQSFFRFALLALPASVLAITAVYWYSQSVWGNVAREFPFESLTDRLAYETRHRATAGGEDARDSNLTLTVAAIPPAEPLAELDGMYELGSGRGIPRRRMWSLQMAHATQLEKFMNFEESFGVRRVPPPSPGFAVKLKEPAVRLPEVKLLCAPDEVAAFPLTAPADMFTKGFHNRALASFAYNAGWGYVRDRDHVAGFESHGFRELPDEPKQEWLTVRLDLVSLLKHDEPGVYISEYLPAMDELRDAPVRPLDAFEERSLAVLVQGGEIEAEALNHQVRMLGAIRAADKCLQCHTVEHGALLGAFSYVLLPVDMVQK